MHHRIAILTPLIILTTFFCSVAEEKAKKSELEEETTAEIGKWEGLQGIKWGTPRAEIDGIYEHEKSDRARGIEKAFNFFSYSRKEEPVRIGGVTVDEVRYTFTNDLLISVNMSTRGKENLALLTKFFFDEYGKPFDSATTSHAWGEFDNHDYGTNVELMHIDTNNDSITITLSSCLACNKEGHKPLDCAHGDRR